MITSTPPRAASVQPRRVIGLDLSGPTNIQDTCLATAEIQVSDLILTDIKTQVGDTAVLEAAARLIHTDHLIVGMDAPLSYNPGAR